MDKFNNEFRGFFFADGCASIVKLNRTAKYNGKRVGEITRKYITYSARLQITQRDDNAEMLERIKELYGGAIYKTKSPSKIYDSKPTVTWVIERTDLVHEISAMLLNSAFHYRNIDAVKAVYEFCDWRLERGLQVKRIDGDVEKIEKWRDRVTKAHKYQGYKSNRTDLESVDGH